MEPARLTPPPSDDAWIDMLLRPDAQSPLPDDGFRSRVLAALPPRRRGFSAWRRPALCLVAALAGLAVAWLAGGGAAGFSAAGAQLMNGLAAVLTPIAIGWQSLALAILIVGALAYVLATELKQERSG